MQDLSVVAQLRQAGLPLPTILQSKVHGRGGLKHRHLSDVSSSSDTESSHGSETQTTAPSRVIVESAHSF
jgi:hypothetical protein